MTNNETEFANQDEEISYKDMWLELKTRFEDCKKGAEMLARQEKDREQYSRYLTKADEMETALFFMRAVESKHTPKPREETPEERALRIQTLFMTGKY